MTSRVKIHKKQNVWKTIGYSFLGLLCCALWIVGPGCIVKSSWYSCDSCREMKVWIKDIYIKKYFLLIREYHIFALLAKLPLWKLMLKNLRNMVRNWYDSKLWILTKTKKPKVNALIETEKEMNWNQYLQEKKFVNFDWKFAGVNEDIIKDIYYNINCSNK